MSPTRSTETKAIRNRRTLAVYGAGMYGGLLIDRGKPCQWSFVARCKSIGLDHGFLSGIVEFLFFAMPPVLFIVLGVKFLTCHWLADRLANL